jgi:signal transduction histidine kinase
MFNKILEQQLRQYFPSNDNLPPEFQEFLAHVSSYYDEMHSDSFFVGASKNIRQPEKTSTRDCSELLVQEPIWKVDIEEEMELDRRNRDYLINSTKDLMWSLDRDFRLITANKAFIKKIKLSTGVEKKCGDKLLNPSIYSPKEIRRWERWYSKALNGKSFTVEYHASLPFKAWSEVSFNPIIENGKVIGASCFLRDINERKRASEQIKKSEGMMAEALRIAHFGSWELELKDLENLDNNELIWSDEIFRLLWLEPGSLEPSFNIFLQYVHKDDRNFVLRTLNQAIRSETSLFMDFRFFNQGKVRWIRATADPIFDEVKGKNLRMVGTAKDITEQKLMEEERERITSDLIQRNKDLEQFTYIISHNLRAPVANIRGLATIIQTHQLEEADYKKCLAGLETSVRRLDEIIVDLNGILQVRREVNEKRSHIAFSDIGAEIIDDIHELIEKEKVVIKYDFQAWDQLFSVKSYIYSIFYNLITNSIKYRSPLRTPIIEVKTNIVGSKLVLEFADNSMGIDLGANHDKVFGLYKRFHHHVEGKGVGLFMVKTQVETLGGKVSVSSAVNKGTTFRIEFPVN